MLTKQQTVLTTLWRKNIKIVIGIVVLILIIVLVFIAAIYVFHWDLVGFINSPKETVITEIIRSPQEKVTTTEEGKAFWDWLQILGVLAIPIVVGFGIALFSRQQTKISEANAKNQQQEELLRTYFDKISDLLLDEKLSTNPNIQSIVRARTLAMLHLLTPERKAIVLRFLHDAGLFQHVKFFLCSLDLSGADLGRIDLSGANLSGANLSGANLSSVAMYTSNLSAATLSGATLSETNLYRADLSGATLHNADLSHADLRHADLSGANLYGADLRGANLRATIVSPEQFKRAKNVTLEQRRQIESLKSVAIQEAKVAQTSTTSVQPEIKPTQTNQEETQRLERKLPKQGADTTY